MKPSSQVSYTLLIAAVAIVAGSLVTVAVMSLQNRTPAPVPMKTPPPISLPAPKPTTETTPTATTPTPAPKPVASGTPVSTYAQGITILNYTGGSPGKASLDDYRYILEKTVSDYWMKTYSAQRPGVPGIVDLDLDHWVEQLPQVSIPASLTTWPTVTTTPWTSGHFSIEFSKAEGSGTFDFGNTLSVRYIGGYVAGLDKNSETGLTAVACPASTPDDVTMLANMFAMAYPPAINDKDLCSHITSVAVTSKDYAGTKAYTLNTAFTPFDGSDGWFGGEGTVYRPTIIMKAAKKEEMIEAFKQGHFSIVEIYLRTTGKDKISVLTPAADLIVSLMSDTNVDGWCGYDNCY
jgi:hypothetical protein